MDPAGSGEECVAGNFEWPETDEQTRQRAPRGFSSGKPLRCLSQQVRKVKPLASTPGRITGQDHRAGSPRRESCLEGESRAGTPGPTTEEGSALAKGKTELQRENEWASEHTLSLGGDPYL
ncbi:hypothetical protein Dimus_039461 [Dionaea muscipula]